MVTIQVGRDADGKSENFVLYRGLLGFHSAYFDSLLGGGYPGEEHRSVRIQDLANEHFRSVFYWMNTGILQTVSGTRAFFDLVYIYGFAERYMFPRLKNTIIEHFVLKINQHQGLPIDLLPEIYYTTPVGSPLRKLVVDFALDVYTWGDLDDEEDKEPYPCAFLTEVLRAARGRNVAFGKDMKKGEWISNTLGRLCDYHDHTDPHQGRSANSSFSMPVRERKDSETVPWI